jgi:hypothetical protein
VNLDTREPVPRVPTRHPSQLAHVVDNYIDGGWYTQVAAFSGNAVSISATSIDTGTTITGLSGGEYVRLMVPYGTGTATVDGIKVTDGSATYQTWGVKRGSILRMGSAFAIVQAVESQTVLWVEEWLSDTDRTPIVTPAGASYTVYKVILGMTASVSGSTININSSQGWLDVDGNLVTTPASGTRFEVQDNVGGHGVRFNRSISRSIVDRNRILRCQADQVSITGDYCRVTNNLIEFGQDMGITLESGSGHIISGNTILHQGANCIIALDATDHAAGHVISDNQCADAMCVSKVASVGACIRIENASNNLVANNRCERVRVLTSTDPLKYAILVNRVSSTTEKNLIVGNRGENFPSTNPWFFVTGANADQNQLLDNLGGTSASTDKTTGGTTNTTIRTPEQRSATGYVTAATTAVGTTYAPIAFNANVADIDIGDVHSTSTNNTRFIARSDGLYLAVGQVQFTAGATGAMLAVRITATQLGGASVTQIAWIFQETAPVASPWPKTLGISGYLQMKVGDYIEFEVSSDVATTFQGGQRHNTFGSLAKVW